MKTSRSSILAILVTAAVFNTHALQAQAPSQAAPDSKAIPFSELGAKATADYKGEAIGITATADGARLHTGFQKLAATVTREGLRLDSTESEGGGLQLRADAIGRVAAEAQKLPATGIVQVQADLVRWARPGLIEEYSVTADGLRQDFIVPKAPLGTGVLSVELALSGARAEPQGEGVKLTLTSSGRQLAYAKLHVVDANNHPLTAHLQVLSPTRLAVRVQDTAATYPIRIDPTFSDADWVSLNPGVPGTNGSVNAIVADGNGNLYIGGDFTFVGTVAASLVAKWNGIEWSALGAGIDLGDNAKVTVLALSDNNLYAGGSFSRAGGTLANNIAKWNGSEWSALGSGLDDDVYALAINDSSLFVGGSFSSAGGTLAAHIAKWNGTEWSALGSGMDGDIYALASSGSTLYAGGFFVNAGGTPSYSIARWNGSVWSALGSGIVGRVYALAVNGNELFAGGLFSKAGGKVANHIARWNGSVWSALSSGMEWQVNALAASGGNLYAGGMFTAAGGTRSSFIARWNGSSWTSLNSGLNYFVNALTLSASDLYVGGRFTSAGQTPVSRVAKWDGTVWTAFGSGMDGYVQSTAMMGNDLIVGGYFTSSGGKLVNHIAKWNGSSWSALGSGLTGDKSSGYYANVYALAVSGCNLYAGGSFTKAGDVTVNNIAKWNGSMWSALGPGLNGTVFSIAVSGSDLYAGGVFSNSGNTRVNSVAKWNDQAWSPLGSGMYGYNDAVHALVLDGGDLYAGGNFTKAGDVPANCIAKWNGNTWAALGSGLNNRVLTLVGRGSDLYAGGEFSYSGSTYARSIALWNGNDWSPLGSGFIGAGLNGSVHTMVMNGGNLYVGGSFTKVQTLQVNHIARWDGSAWSSLGSGLNGTVHALGIMHSNRLYVGGNFGYAGSTVTPFITQADLLPQPHIAVLHQTSAITNAASNVGLGSVDVTTGSLSRVFTIRNVGGANLNLTGTPPVALSGSPNFSVQTQPSTPLLADDLTTFQIIFDPASAGVHRAKVNIANDDLSVGPFTFSVFGVGLAPNLTQAITFAPPASVFVGQSQLVLTAEAGSGLPVTLRVVSGPASLSGGALTFTGIGTVKVEATQAGGGRYKAAAPVVRTITVRANPTALTLINLNQRYDGNAKPISTLGSAAIPVITYKVGTTYVSTPPTAAGSYAVRAVVGSTTVNGTLTITKAPLFVTPDDQRKFAGQPNPALTYQISGFLGSENASVLTKTPVLTTTATVASVGGTYPINANGATALNYSFIYQQGSLFVETFAGNYEALIEDGSSNLVGKLSITVAATSKTFTAKLATATETSAVSFTGPLLTVGEQATGNATTLVGTAKVPYNIDFTLPIVGAVSARVGRSNSLLGRATSGQKLSTATVAYAGAHTAVLEPATPTGSNVPAGAGWASANISSTGILTLAGRLGDGTTFTTALNPDGESNPGYRLFVQPYLPVRTQSYLGGSFSLEPHPTLAGRRYLEQYSLTWKKTGLPADPSYRAGFGPVNTVLMIDPWLAPKTTAPAITLAQRLGLTGSNFGVTHSATGSASLPNLPTRLGLSTTNVVSVLTPSANLTKWKTLSFVPTTGTFTGSFELTDAIKRPVTFSGVLRQPATLADPLIGSGHYLLPPLSGTERTTGEIMFTRP